MTSTSDPINFLLVDDLEENLLALEALLKRDGLAFLKARSGEEALDLLLTHDIALALLDVQMPGMDGFELAGFMRGNERTRHIPIIFLTAGSADLQRRFRGYDAGAVDFIQKPIEADILRSKTNVFYELYRQRSEIVAQRDALASMADALQAADRRKNEFLAILGHELRNPIAAIGAGLHLLERRAGTGVEGEIREGMNRHIRHVSRLVDDLLDIARIDQGKISLKLERISLQDVLAFAIEASQPLIESGGHRLVRDLPDATIWLEADFSRLAQIASNLLNNAAKYTPPGGEIRLTARRKGPWAEVEVADNGIGIPPEMQEKIFDLFAQVSRPGSDRLDGLGIGLALVKQLVGLHGGTLHLERSEMGKGSVFLVRLPCEP